MQYSACDYAKYFMRKGLDTHPNTFDGNMKLQKILFFADYISIAKTGKRLFPDTVMAFKNGCVVETVRLAYKTNYTVLHTESQSFNPIFTEEVSEILQLTETLFGHLTATELSELTHIFDFWKNAYARSKTLTGYADKTKAVISVDEMLGEVDKINNILNAYASNSETEGHIDIINGIKFYIDNEVEITEYVINTLEDFSKTADEKSYTVYSDNGMLVIY